MLKAVIFDFDGVLIDSHKVINNIFIDQMKKHFNHDILEKEFSEMSGLRFEQRIEILGKKYNFPVSQEKINKIIEEGREEYRDKHLEEVFIFPGARELIVELNKNNIKIALGSNGSRKPVIQMLEYLDLKKYFSSIVTATDVDNYKPHPEMFLKNTIELGVKPNECVVIEDSITGIIAAKQAGIKVIAVKTTASEIQLKNADLIVESIKDIDLDLIRKVSER